MANLAFPASPDAAVAAARAAIAEAAEAGALLVCFPECFVPGYRALGAPVPPADADWLEEAHTQVAAAAGEAGIAVALGTERFVDGALRITVLVIGRIVIVGGVASGGIVGTTWVSYQALCASSESQSSVTR